MADATKRVALITGANKGIGLEVARQVGKAGCTVLVGARNVELGREAALRLKVEGHDAHFIALDVVKPETIKRAAEEIERNFGRLDILVNNAGIAALGRDGAPSTADIEAVRATIETNFIGALAVTQAMLPLLRKSKSASIVNVSSELGSITGHTTPEWKFAHVRAIGYSASKAAMNMMTAQLALELAGTAIKVNSVNPGYTATDLNKHSGPQTVQEGAAETIRLALAGPDGPTGGFYETGGTLPW
jgi:NAD(P)-dependent dehydrogenase (short-subunit alcohol dehydrogenase family)